MFPRNALSATRVPVNAVQRGVPAPRPATCSAAPSAAAAPTNRSADIGRALLTAHGKAVELFKVLESQDLLQPGRTEEEVNKDIYELAARHFGTRKYWHTRLVRAGANSVHPIHVRAPVLELAEDDILFVDLGPIFDQNIEADFARTYVLGGDPEKHKLAAALPKVFAACKREYLARPHQTGAEFYAFVCRTCEEHGYKYGNEYCAHLLDEFSHKQKFGMEAANFARPENHTPMSAPSHDGRHRFWVLEIHLLQDPAVGTYGGFYEDLLNLPLPDENF